MHVEDEDGAHISSQNPEADQLVENGLAHPRPAEYGERLLAQPFEVQVDVEFRDPSNRAQGGRPGGLLVNEFHVRLLGVTGLGEVGRDGLGRRQPARPLLDELDGLQEGLGVEDGAPVALLHPRGHHGVPETGACQALGDVGRFVDHVLHQAIEVVSPPLDDDRVPDPQVLRVFQLQLGLQTPKRRGGDDLTDLHFSSLVTWSRYW